MCRNLKMDGAQSQIGYELDPDREELYTDSEGDQTQLTDAQLNL
jgi:hypothetical protein